MLNNALKSAVSKSFNRISVDGDTSVCDMVLLLANGEASNPTIIDANCDYEVFESFKKFLLPFKNAG